MWLVGQCVHGMARHRMERHSSAHQQSSQRAASAAPCPSTHARPGPGQQRRVAWENPSPAGLQAALKAAFQAAPGAHWRGYCC